MEKLKNTKSILDIGAGFGRLTPLYIFRAQKIILADPSAKLLKLAKLKVKNRKVVLLQSKVENLLSKIHKNSIDLVILVRVLHHIKDLNEAFYIINKICKKGGFFILEFANKSHIKATFHEFIKGNLTFPLDIFPKDIRSKKSIRLGTLPFVNYHPDFIKEKLKEYNFKIVESRSVSNIRSPFLKRIIPLDLLLYLEKNIQRFLSVFNFGPSIFILARKIK
jgi:ubiquinone/menaquinone biosynthesis C-methylase UbiE